MLAGRERSFAFHRRGVQLDCEYLTFGGPVLIRLCASLEAGWRRSYSQKSDAKGSFVLILNIDHVRFFELWTFRMSFVILDSESIHVYLARRGTSTTAIYQDRCTTLDLDAVSYPTLTHMLRETLFTCKQLPVEKLGDEPNPSDIDLAITQAPADRPFASVFRSARRACHPKSAVHFHLLSNLRFTTKCLPWIPPGAVSKPRAGSG
jgi:hypothetical protein